MRHMLLNIPQAVDCLRNGQIIAYPTEAVFGLGCDPGNEKALRILLTLKNRPDSDGLILIGSRFEQFEAWVAQVTSAQLETAQATWPGPVTWLFPRGRNVPDLVAGNHDTIAIRVTGHAPCVELCQAFGGPLVSTSANPHSARPARSAGEVEDYFGSFIGGILEGPLGGREHASGIRDLASGKTFREG